MKDILTLTLIFELTSYGSLHAQGEKVFVELHDGQTLEGELLTVHDSVLVVDTLGGFWEEDNVNENDGLAIIRYQTVKRTVVGRHIGQAVFTGILTGVSVAILNGLVWKIVGGLVASVISRSDNELMTSESRAIQELRRVSRYEDAAPRFLIAKLEDLHKTNLTVSIMASETTLPFEQGCMTEY